MKLTSEEEKNRSRDPTCLFGSSSDKIVRILMDSGPQHFK